MSRQERRMPATGAKLLNGDGGCHRDEQRHEQQPDQRRGGNQRDQEKHRAVARHQHARDQHHEPTASAPAPSSRCTRNHDAVSAHHRRPTTRSAAPAARSPPRYDAATTRLIAPATNGWTRTVTRMATNDAMVCASLDWVSVATEGSLITSKKLSPAEGVALEERSEDLQRRHEHRGDGQHRPGVRLQQLEGAVEDVTNSHRVQRQGPGPGTAGLRPRRTARRPTAPVPTARARPTSAAATTRVAAVAVAPACPTWAAAAGRRAAAPAPGPHEGGASDSMGARPGGRSSSEFVVRARVPSAAEATGATPHCELATSPLRRRRSRICSPPAGDAPVELGFVEHHELGDAQLGVEGAEDRSGMTGAACRVGQRHEHHKLVGSVDAPLLGLPTGQRRCGIEQAGQPRSRASTREHAGRCAPAGRARPRLHPAGHTRAQAQPRGAGPADARPQHLAWFARIDG